MYNNKRGIVNIGKEKRVKTNTNENDKIKYNILFYI